MRQRPVRTRGIAVFIATCVFASTALHAQQPVIPRAATKGAMASAPLTDAITPPADYVIGPEDQLSIAFFNNKDMSADVVVRSDGKISLPLLNDVQASGLTPEQLRERITAEAKQFVQSPTPTVIVRQINSRKIFIIGAVQKPGAYLMIAPMTVLHLIATAGGLTEYANGSKIVIMRAENGTKHNYPFNYKDVVTLRNVAQNITLKPGDIVVVP
jgi:polysaccharide export outer membrane protein